MSETLWAVIIGGAVGALAPIVTTLINLYKWKNEQQVSETRIKRETLLNEEARVNQTTAELLKILSELRRIYIGDLGHGDTGVSSNQRLSIAAHADLLGKNYSWEVAIDLYLSDKERERVKGLRDRFSVHEEFLQYDFAPLVDEVLSITRLVRERIRRKA